MQVKKEMPRLTPDRDEFAQFYVMFKQWFNAEELEVSDYVLGRFASRLQDFIKFGLGKEQESEESRLLHKKEVVSTINPYELKFGKDAVTDKDAVTKPDNLLTKKDI